MSRPLRIRRMPSSLKAALQRTALLAASAALLTACDNGNVFTGVGDFASQTGQSLYTQAVDQFATPRQYANDPLLYDGSYQGNTHLVSASGDCQQPRYGAVMIGDNILTYPYTPQQVFTVPVLPDGTLHGVAGDTVLDGRINGDRLRMTISSPTCTSEYRTRFILNHS